MSDAIAFAEPETLSVDELRSRHPQGKQLKVVMNPTRSGFIMLNELDVNSTLASYSAHSREIALQLGGEGWADSKTVWGVRLDDCGGGTIPIRLIAGLLANGDWRCFDSHEDEKDFGVE